MRGDPIFDVTSALGECPVWDHRTGHLWWVDIDGRTVWRGDPMTGVADAFPGDGRPAAIALTTDPNIVVVAREGELAWLHEGVFTPWVTLERLDGNRLNDGRVMPDGSFWVGSMFADTSARRRTGVLHRVLADGTSTVMRTGIGVTNGLAADRERLFFADSFDRTVERYTFPDLGDHRTFADLATIPDLPVGTADGGCLDSEGRYWLAAVHGSRLLAFDREGTLVESIELPVLMPTRPTFGGPDLDRLFVTSIGSRPGGADGGYGLDGRVLILDVGAQGVPEEIFGASPPDSAT